MNRIFQHITMNNNSTQPGPFIKARTWLQHQVRLIFIALQFFTRIQIPAWVGFDDSWLHQASRYFVLVGVLIGALASSAYFCLTLLFPQMIAVLLSTIFSIYLTGAFHEDGFADVCDGFGGAVTPERTLEIMKDSRIGAYGAIGILLMLALKCASLFYLPTQTVIAALLVGHPVSRLASSAFIWRLNYVRAEGKAKPLAQHMTTGEFMTALCCALLPIAMVLALGWLSWLSLLTGLIALVVAGVYLSRVFVRRIGGYTGDCLGAVQQLSEVAFYLGLVAALRMTY